MEFDEVMFDAMNGKIQGVNLQEGVQRLGGNKAKYLKILSLFLNSQAKAIAQLPTMEDIQSKAIAAHSCKGAGSNIGAEQIAKMAAKLEEKFNNDETVTEQEISGLKDVLEDALATFNGIAEQHVPQQNDAPEDDLKPIGEEMLVALNELQTSLQEFDIGVQDKLSSLSSQLPRWFNQLQEFKELQDAVIQFDFLTAEEHLKSLKKKVG